jgi:hypothetical protein
VAGVATCAKRKLPEADVQSTSRMEKIGVALLTCRWQLASSAPVKGEVPVARLGSLKMTKWRDVTRRIRGRLLKHAFMSSTGCFEQLKAIGRLLNVLFGHPRLGSFTCVHLTLILCPTDRSESHEDIGSAETCKSRPNMALHHWNELSPP